MLLAGIIFLTIVFSKNQSLAFSVLRDFQEEDLTKCFLNSFPNG